MVQTTKRALYRQGDVLLDYDGTSIEEPPGTPVAREGRRIVLAHGEATGHAHAIEARDAVLYEHPQTHVRRLRLVQRTTALLHEEHTHIPLPPGLPRVRRDAHARSVALRTRPWRGRRTSIAMWRRVTILVCLTHRP